MVRGLRREMETWRGCSAILGTKLIPNIPDTRQVFEPGPGVLRVKTRRARCSEIPKVITVRERNAERRVAKKRGWLEGGRGFIRVKHLNHLLVKVY